MCSIFSRKFSLVLLVSFLVWLSPSFCYGEDNQLLTSTTQSPLTFTSSQLSHGLIDGGKNTPAMSTLPTISELLGLLEEADQLMSEYEDLVVSLRNQNKQLSVALTECEESRRKTVYVYGIGFGIAVAATVVATIIAITK